MQRSTHVTMPFDSQAGPVGGALRSLIAIVFLVIALFAPAVVAAQEAGAPTEAAPVVLAEPTATGMPEIVPTAEPTLEPALESTIAPPPEPTATEVVMPEPTATVEPTVEPTATDVPTLAPTIPAPTMVPTAQPSPTAVPSPTPSPTPGSRSTVAGSGRLCSQASASDVAGFGHGQFAYVVFDCTSPKGNGNVTLSVSTPTSGWQYQIVESRTNPGLWRTGPFANDIQNLGSFQIYLGPVNASVQGCGQVTVSVKAPSGEAGSSTLRARTEGADASCTVTPSPQPVSVSLSGGALPALPFSLDERRVEGRLQIVVTNPSNTTGWTLDASATDLAYSGPASGQGSWPASSLRVQVSGGSVIPLSNATQRIVSNGGGDASYTYPVTLIVPGGSPTGTYTGTITLTTTAAPGGR